MSDTISSYLNKIKTARYGSEVLSAICGALEECYSDVNSPSLKKEAFKKAIQELNESGIFAGFTLGDGSITNSKLADGSVTKDKIAPSVTFGLDAATKKALLDLLAKVDYTSENGKLLYKRLKSTLEMESFTKNKILEIEYSEADVANKYLTDKVSGYKNPARANNPSSVAMQCRYYKDQSEFDSGVGAKGLSIVVVYTKNKDNSGTYGTAHGPLYLNGDGNGSGIAFDGVFSYTATTGGTKGSYFNSWRNNQPINYNIDKAFDDYAPVPYTLIASFGTDGSITIWVNGKKVASGLYTDFANFSTSSNIFVYSMNNNMPDAGCTFYLSAYRFCKSTLMYEGVFTDEEASTVNDFFLQ